MDSLRFIPTNEIIKKPQLLATSKAIEDFNKNFSSEFIATIKSNKFLEKSERVNDLTGIPSDIDLKTINRELTLLLLESYYSMESLKKLLLTVRRFQTSMKLANTRDWYRHFIMTHPKWRGDINAK